MKVILLKDVRGCGQAHEVKDVADGYAINFLLPRKAAEIATDERVQAIEAQAAARVAERAKEDEALNGKVASLNGKTISIFARATEKGGLFKSVTAGDVAKAIRTEHSLEIPEDAIVLGTPVKTVGEHEIKLEGKGQKAALTLMVSAAQ